jgi:hypothetical protein
MVTCYYEQCNKKLKSLAAHLRIKHNISVAEYTKWCADNEKRAELGYTWASKPDPISKKQARIIEGNEDLVEGLTTDEKNFFADRYQTLWENSNEDPVLSATIAQVVMNEIFVRRYQMQAKKLFTASGKVDPGDLNKLHNTINQIQNQTLSLLTSLNLTKEKRDQLNKSPESTPSRMVTSLALVCATMTPSERAKNEKDIEEAMKRLREHTVELVNSIPTTGEQTQVETIDIG